MYKESHPPRLRKGSSSSTSRDKIIQKDNKMGPESDKLNISDRKIDNTVTPDRFQALPRLKEALKELKITPNRPKVWLKFMFFFVATCTFSRNGSNIVRLTFRDHQST